MTWDQSTVIGPAPIPIYGAPVTDPDTGQTYTPITGYDGTRYCLITTTDFLAANPSLQSFSQPQPQGLPILQETLTVWLIFPDEGTATSQTALSAYWV